MNSRISKVKFGATLRNAVLSTTQGFIVNYGDVYTRSTSRDITIICKSIFLAILQCPDSMENNPDVVNLQKYTIIQIIALT